MEPAEETIVAPVSGVISSIAETKHAVGITSDDGLEVLIHVGVDTVKMKGEGFEVFVHEGDRVEAGQKLIDFDSAKIKAAGYSTVTAVLLVNSADFNKIDTNIGERKRLDEIIRVN